MMMRNALDEINEILSREGVFLTAAKVSFGCTYDDEQDEFVLHVGHADSERAAFDNFVNRQYDAGYGGQELYGTLWFSNHRWAERGEYDGSEWWEICEFPDPPRKES